jgi:hypothetical protein
MVKAEHVNKAQAEQEAKLTKVQEEKQNHIENIKDFLSPNFYGPGSPNWNMVHNALEKLSLDEIAVLDLLCHNRREEVKKYGV